jgi:hypothetical protein
MSLSEKSLTYRLLKYAGWTYVLLAILILLVSSGIRTLDLLQHPTQIDAYEIRYLDHPLVGLLHLIPGLIFLVFAPLQFIKKIRSRHLGFHRVSGRVMLGCGLFSGVMGIIAAFSLPAFGGVGAQTASVLFGLIFTFSLARAFYLVRHKQIALHREWMIRAFSLGSSVATIRIVIGLMQVFGDFEMETIFANGFWLGFTFNLLVGEIWINLTRSPGSTRLQKTAEPSQ